MPVSPETRASAFYFTQFMNAAVSTVLGGIWFSQQGLSSAQIGIINATPVFAMLAINIVVGRIADRAADWRQVIIIGAFASALASIGLFFVGGFWPILLVWTLIYLPLTAVGPVADAAAMRMTRRHGTEFGVIRAWGTVGYMLVLFATGYIGIWFGVGAFVALYVGVAVLRALAALGLPNFRAPKQETVATATRGAKRLMEVMQPWFVLPLLGYAMVFSTHLVLNGFQSLLLIQRGIPADITGILIAIGAASEAGFMFVFRRFARRFSARALILLSAAVSVFRFALMGFSPGVELLLALQLLHGITFSLGLLGCISFIANWTSEDIAAEAQGFFVMLQQAMAVLALTAFGWLAGPLGAQAYWASAAFAAVGGVMVVISMRLKQPRPA